MRIRIRVEAGSVAEAMARLFLSTRGALGGSLSFDSRGWLDHPSARGWSAGRFPGGVWEYGHTLGRFWRSIVAAARGRIAAPRVVSLSLATAERAVAAAPAASNGRREDLWHPWFAYSPAFVVAVLFTALVVLAGLACWNYQLEVGLGVAGFQRPFMGGLYGSSFVFWLGISTAGAALSAILRITDAVPRHPVTRTAAMIMVSALPSAFAFLLLNVGRPGSLIPASLEPPRLNFHSPLLWSAVALATYLAASLAYAHVTLCIDTAELQARALGWQAHFCRFFFPSWMGSDRQWLAWRRAVRWMAAITLALAVAASVTAAWCFLTPRLSGWRGFVFGVRFLAAEACSGIAVVLLALAAIRKTLRLDWLVKPWHLEKLGQLLFWTTVTWFLPAAAEYLALRTAGAHGAGDWPVLLCALAALLLLTIRRLWSIPGAALASCFVLAGVGLDYYWAIARSLPYPGAPGAWEAYSPTGIEIVTTAAGLAGFLLLCLIFSKLFPLIAGRESGGPSPHRESSW